LTPSIAVVDEAATVNRSAIMQCLFERVEHKAGMGGSRGAPADDAPCEDIDDKRDID
jgi:hypothetical protein